MRGRTFRQFIQSGAGERIGTKEQEAEVARDAALAKELHETILLPFLAKHIALENDDFLVPALLHAAALHAMGRYQMTPDDFGAFATIVAESSKGEVAAMLAKLGALLNKKETGGRA